MMDKSADRMSDTQMGLGWFSVFLLLKNNNKQIRLDLDIIDIHLDLY